MSAMNDVTLAAFLDEMSKIAQESGPSRREMVQDLSPRPKGLAEKVLPVAGTMAGTMGGASLLGALGPGGWKGTALKGLGAITGGLSGLGLGGAAQKSLIRGRRIQAYEQLTGRQVG